MSFLLDTNVISEWVKARPNRGVVAWLATVDEDQVFISVVTLAELRHGIERMTTGGRRRPISWLPLPHNLKQSSFVDNSVPPPATPASGVQWE